MTESARPDIDVFLRELAELRARAWKALAATSTADADDGAGQQDPAWLQALTAAQDAWEDGELASRTQDVQDMMDTVSRVAATAGRHGPMSAELLRRAAAALAVRPWVDPEVFVRAYGAVDRVIPIATLGPVPEARRRLGPPRPRKRIAVSATITTQLTVRRADRPRSAGDDDELGSVAGRGDR